ncbi:MAG: phosphatase PAP2 family protein [Phycisphaerales bacterium]|nr:MAG: phosphatase PAP2 family protein [Phycisphaerales bacterium]
MRFPDSITALDHRITGSLPVPGRAVGLFWKLVTCGGYGEIWGPVYLALIVWPASRLLGLQLLAAEALGLAVLIPLRYSLRRPRPVAKKPGPVPVPWERYSFPSSHALRATEAAAVMAVNFPWLWPVALPLALLVAWSRVVLRRHYTSDAVVGILLGLACGLLAATLVPTLIDALHR